MIALLGLVSVTLLTLSIVYWENLQRKYQKEEIAEQALGKPAKVSFTIALLIFGLMVFL